MPAISVVIPVYNAGQFLDRCVQSITNQSFRDIEIILVDDGSTDDSALKLEFFAKTDARIYAYSKSNGGVSTARNYGIEKATGRYIAFVDADDWIDVDMLARLFAAAESCEGGASICTYWRERRGLSSPLYLDFDETTRLNNKSEVEQVILRRLIGPIGTEISRPHTLHSMGSACGKLYCLAVIKELKLRFLDLTEIGTSEDELFNIHYFAHVDSAVVLNVALYHYSHENPGSITAKYKPRLQKQWIKLFAMIRDVICQTGTSPTLVQALENRMALSVLGLGMNLTCTSERPGFRNSIRQLKEIVSEERTSLALKNLKLDMFPLHWKMFYRFAREGRLLPLYVLLRCINVLRKIY